MFKITSFSKTALAIVLLLFIGQLIAWHKPPVKTPILKAIEITSSMPVTYAKDGTRFYYITDTMFKISYEAFTVLKLTPVVQFETGKNIKGSEPYFIYENGATYGYYFKTINDTSQGKKMLVDSFLTTYLRTSDADITPPDSIWALHETIKNPQDGSLLEKYNVVGKYAELKPENEWVFDSIYYYYSKKLNNIDYTFSKALDSARGMKLYKIRGIYNSKFSPTVKLTLPKREIQRAFREVTLEDPGSVLAFIERFKTRQKQ